MVKPDGVDSNSVRVSPFMARVTCGKCSRELEYGGDRPSFCAYCGQSLASTTPEETTAGWSGPPTAPGPATPPGRGEQTIDFVPKPGQGPVGEVPERVKGYRLIRQLGRGGMGTVYEAEDSRHGRKVALKIIAPGYVESSGAVERFRQEGRLASSLAHPRCVFVLEADEDDDGRPFIAMELMTGDTLQDLVEKGGPLAVGDAVSRILDVVEGLREAHRLGLIHRDVKPSNCFLDGEGRVKVGDFGLSKSQVGSSHLTRTGSFLGTPLYASPEQIKVEPLDCRTDVYSTSATLFYLLTGRAPFDRGDASATMARIVTDPAPSAREKRPEVPAGLDRVIRRGLERDLDRRYRDLDEFRAALSPFVPGHVPAAQVSLRIGAYLLDGLVIMALLIGIGVIDDRPAVGIASNFLIMLAYFSIGDGIWGGTPGKRLLRLRVADARGRDLASFRQATLRTLVFLVLADIPGDVMMSLEEPWNRWPVAFGVGGSAVVVLGIAALAFPMRAANELRGLHDLASGTRVISLPRDERRRVAGPRRTIGRERGSGSRPIGVMQSVGPYKVRGAVRWEANRRVVSGEDSTLGREAWIVIRPKGSVPPGPARREVARATRPRWLACGDQAEGHWDAYVAPNGTPLADFAGPEGLPWRDARPILEDMADELAAARLEGTLPPGLTVDQVWVQPDGRAILVDALAFADAPDESSASDDDRALSLLRRVAALALEGGRCRADAIPKAIRSPMPIHASALLARLLGGPDPFRDVVSFRDELNATRHQPTEVTRGHRAMSLAFLAVSLSVGLAVTDYGVGQVYSGGFDPKAVGGSAVDEAIIGQDRLGWTIFLTGLFPAAWTVWDFLTRGGFALRLSGLGLVLGDGRPAPRWRCAWRTFVTWAPMTALFVASVWLDFRYPNSYSAHRVPLYAALGLPGLYAVLALVFPSRGPHDWLSGLRVVPR
jgi:uncharacterized RDD family membrane protein YckC